MKLNETTELKNIKVHADMSQETPCFSCTLHKNGVKIATVSNSGHGGSNDFYPEKGYTYADIEEYTDLDTEAEIMSAVELYAEIVRHQATKLVLRKIGTDEIYLQKLAMPFAKLKQVKGFEGHIRLTEVRRRMEGYEILNFNMESYLNKEKLDNHIH